VFFLHNWRTFSPTSPVPAKWQLGEVAQIAVSSMMRQAGPDSRSESPRAPFRHGRCRAADGGGGFAMAIVSSS